MRKLLPILLPILLLAACHQPPKPKLYDPQQVAFSATYNPDFDGIIYPSIIAALANYKGDNTPELFSVSVTAPANNSVLRVVIDSSALNYVTILQEVLPRKGETYTFQPMIKWKYDYLYRLKQQGAIDLTFTCYINDEEVDLKNLRLNYRNINECLLSVRTTANKVLDYRWLFSAYVNEDHPYIDSILTTILSQGVTTTFSGYQKGAKDVSNQVLAVWNYALQRGITYSSITCTSNPSPRSNSQHIRFFDEVYLTRQANCIDACVFFASILRKIGIQTVILVEPCHTYLGYYTDKQRKNLRLLETTITGWINFPLMEASVNSDTGLISDEYLRKAAKYASPASIQKYKEGTLDLEKLELEIARTLFDKATEYDVERFEQNKPHFANTDEFTYQMLVIDDLRKEAGPIQRNEY